MSFKTIALAGALAAVILAPAAASAKDWKKVTVALEGGYAPWNLTDASGQIVGFEPDLLKVLCEHADLECTMISQDWDGMITALNAGKFDVIMDALSITPERQKVIDFTVPYAATPAVFAAPKDSELADLPGTGTVIKLEDVHDQADAIAPLREAMKGKTIGIQSSTVYANFVYENFGDVATIKEYKTAAERDLDLSVGRIDAGFEDATYLLGTFEASENNNLAFTGPEIGGQIWGEGEGLGLRKSDTDLKAKFDEAIKAAVADGTVKTLSEKWLKVDVTP
ncbi:transporter substrate-binding domain-containing protein [Afifella aestuarii]|uniref:transporter substrate-binding domain-containing protein n=1 Tax=Afifella aestuarii TaxID=1909496 RepID=UPI000FE3179E|nr:transporter substrate-binding domain-containing protein [Afifella aestuarii]